MKRYLDKLIILTLATLLPCVAYALSGPEVFSKVEKSVFIVIGLDRNKRPVTQGSGVLLPKNKIGTNCHVLADADIHYLLVKQNDNSYHAILYSGDTEKDICLLEAKGLHGTGAPIRESKKLKRGEDVYAIGAPEGLELTISKGIFAGHRRGYLQHSAQISHGSSGGGLFDSNGRLVGFTTFTLTRGQDLNFAIPVEWTNGVKNPGLKPLPTKLPPPENDDSGSHQGGSVAGSSFVEPDRPLGTENLPSDRLIFFDGNEDVTPPKMYQKLIERHAIYMTHNIAARMNLQGHTSFQGSREWNLAIGQLRADNVMREFIRLGISPNRIQAISLGEEKAIFPTASSSVFMPPNRVEILYQGE